MSRPNEPIVKSRGRLSTNVQRSASNIQDVECDVQFTLLIAEISI